jgi:hypothetical protein
MSYPSQFNSTLTYEAKYDLDDIDIFIEGDGDNPMFFVIEGLPEKLYYGKHYFYLSLLPPTKQQYKLRDNSKILFEFKSLNGVILKSDVVDLNQKNGVILCYVEVLKDPMRTYKDIEDGVGTLIVAASLENKKNTINKIPKKFEKAINYRCTFPIEIRKNLLNAGIPKPLNSKHELSTTLGQFSFANGSISARRGQNIGFEFNVGGAPSNDIIPQVESTD